MKDCKKCECYNCGTAKDSGGNCGHCEECVAGENVVEKCEDKTSLE